MTNIEKPTAHLNSLQHRRVIYNALMPLVSAFDEQKRDNPYEA